MPIELRLKSHDPTRPNDKLWREIEMRQDELVAFLNREKPGEQPEVSEVDVKPQAGFPIGLETFVIVVAISFAKGFGSELGKIAGRAVGNKIRAWIKDSFPDVEVVDVSEE